jgi:hypothetical protein
LTERKNESTNGLEVFREDIHRNKHAVVRNGLLTVVGRLLTT